MDTNIFYSVEIKNSKCSCCGKSIKNVYYYEGKKYGYYCFMSAIGLPVNKTSLKEKPLPSWVFELMNKYFEKYKGEYSNENTYDQMPVNFFNKYITKGYPNHALWNKTVEVCGKKVPVYQQYMINDYLIMKLKQYYYCK